jgi:AAA+ ATPase superfamily predicted ATPase
MVVKTLNIKENPLADYGNIIHGDRFVGRKLEIATIHNRVLGKNSGNISIIGLPRIGKSSLVWQALLAEKDKYENDKTLITRIDVGEFDNSLDLFSALIAYVQEEIDDKFDEPTKLKVEKTISKVKDQSASNHEKKRNIQKFFKIAQANNFKIIIVLDEFDHANLSDLDCFKTKNPTSEILAKTIFERLASQMDDDKAVRKQGNIWLLIRVL